MTTAGQLYFRKPVPAQIAFVNEDDPEQLLVINCMYYPNRITPKLMRQVLSSTDPAEKTAGLAGMVRKWIDSWDLLEDDGETVVALTQDRLEDFDLEVLDRIISQLNEQQAPNAGTASSSRAGSRGSLV